MRSIVLTGPALEGFALQPGVIAPHVAVTIPSDDACARQSRIYSVRRFDPVALTMEINFVLHGGGLASGWAERARPGDRAGIAGPGGLALETVDRYVIAGDHTALPAIGRLLDVLPAGAGADVFVEVPDEAERQELPSRAGLSVTWLHRERGAPPVASRLPDAVMEATPAGGSGTVAVWTGAEQTVARRIRSHARQTLKLPSGRHSVVAYWKAGVTQGGFQCYD
nr:siderophore-interacting protein [Azospirillum sp. SYSU D00513]